MTKLNAFGKIYDWETWFAGGEKVLRKGKEFRCSFSSICQQARNAANRLGYKICLVENVGKVTITATRSKDAKDPA